MGKVLLMILILAGAGYLLYINGYLIMNVKSAGLFVGSQRGTKATFSACSGYIKRVVKFPADKTYSFTLDVSLTKGDMTAELLDSDKQELMCLKHDDRTAVVTVEKGKRYYLVFRFKSATGTYTLHWD